MNVDDGFIMRSWRSCLFFNVISHEDFTSLSIVSNQKYSLLNGIPVCVLLLLAQVAAIGWFQDLWFGGGREFVRGPQRVQGRALLPPGNSGGLRNYRHSFERQF